MGYDLSTNPIRRHLPQLEQLARSDVTLSFPADSPRRLAYKLRESINACQHHEQYVHLYDAIWTRFKFEEGLGAVIAKCLRKGDGLIVGEGLAGEGSTSPPPVLTPTRPEKKTLPSALGLVEVLAGAIKFSDEEELYFPGVNLSNEEKPRLDKWALANEWKFIDHSALDGEGGLTLTKRNVSEDILWRAEG